MCESKDTCLGCPACLGSILPVRVTIIQEKIKYPDIPDNPDASPETVPQEVVKTIVNLFKREGSMGILAFYKFMREKGYFRPQVEQYMPVLKARGIIEYDKDTVKLVGRALGP